MKELHEAKCCDKDSKNEAQAITFDAEDKIAQQQKCCYLFENGAIKMQVIGIEKLKENIWQQKKSAQNKRIAKLQQKQPFQYNCKKELNDLRF